MAKTICILGRQPEFGLAELERLYGRVESANSSVALVDGTLNSKQFSSLGGVVKVGEIFDVIPCTDFDEIATRTLEIFDELAVSTDKKIRLGISVYGFGVKPSQIADLAKRIKKNSKASGKSVSFVYVTDTELSAAQVIHNGLTKGGIELLLVGYGGNGLIGRTIAVQDISAYGARDQARPKRDAKVGMLPPKLAQIMINLAGVKPRGTVLDPFCGTGVILQEALLMGHPVIGSDIDQRMVDYTKENLAWLMKKFADLPSYQVTKADAKDHKWGKVDGVVAELYLGKPLFTPLSQDEQKAEMDSISNLVTAFLTNLAGQITSGTPVCIALPAWINQNRSTLLPILDQLEDIGYNLMSFTSVDAAKLIYHRPGQLVGRQVLPLIRK